MLCKEVGLTALLVCAGVDCAATLSYLVCSNPGLAPPNEAVTVSHRPRHVLGGSVVRTASLAAGSATLLYARLSLNGWRTPQFSASDNSAAFCETTLCRSLSLSHVSWLNLRLLMLPSNLAHDWSMTTVPNLASWSDPRTPLALLPLGLGAAAVGGALVALRRRCAHAFFSLAAGLALLVLPYLPASGAFVTVGFTVAERVLYLPSSGFCVLLAAAIPAGRPGGSRRSLRRWTSRGCLMMLFVLHGARTLRRNLDWHDQLSLLEADVRHQPSNCKLRYNLGLVLSREGQASRMAEAEHHLKVAQRLLPNFHEAACVEASVLQAQRKLTEAEELLAHTLKMSLVEAQASEGSDGPHVGLKSTDERVRHANQQHRKAHALKGVYYAARGLGGMLEAGGRSSEALQAFLPALQLYPHDSSLTLQTLRVAQAAQDHGATRALFAHAQRIMPSAMQHIALQSSTPQPHSTRKTASDPPPAMQVFERSGKGAATSTGRAEGKATDGQAADASMDASLHVAAPSLESRGGRRAPLREAVSSRWEHRLTSGGRSRGAGSAAPG
jgi:tetratricopeptide (TPR) repeat protein